MKTTFVNGEYLDPSDAKISIFDRGFLFGDAVYEVLPVYNGQPFFVERHIERLNSNLKKIKIEAPPYDWYEIIHRLVTENNGGSLQIYIQVTRGNQGVRKHDIPSSISPSVIAFTMHNPFPSDLDKEKGLVAKLIEDIRWSRCDIKTTSLIANILLNDEAVSSGYQTSILVRDGIINEGSTSNVFLVSQEDVIKTSPLTNLCLPGITRQVAIELISQLNWDFREEDINVSDLFSAKEVWITSTTKEIMPVTQINDFLINKGNVGKYWRIINKSYQQLLS
ncbi:D-amino acid aminotransferase [Legionella maioricensis]|uniref:Aminodeoxychorismate lyase n=1 Tax=Legionella maioricensis TaxID=2896528 RepID=A0A9X2D1M3_9GAMM|nr:D-amino acid aminotransferase [Legionella maioricensis]MCL9684970.1 D-amino acid aminotransferase [Legionella maioricensis]MCL9688133.1 D-amino acid aminotransferase [Legionella maioricensis]